MAAQALVSSAAVAANRLADSRACTRYTPGATPAHEEHREWLEIALCGRYYRTRRVHGSAFRRWCADRLLQRGGARHDDD